MNYKFLLVAFLFVLQTSAQVKDTLVLTNSTTVSGLVLFKSTIQEAINKFGSYQKVDTFKVHVSAYFLGSGCQSIEGGYRRFSFDNNAIIVETAIKTDTITSVFISAPVPAKTMDKIILNSTAFRFIKDKLNQKDLIIVRQNFNHKNYNC